MDKNGLSDEFIVCDDCDKFYKRECSSHGPLQWIKDSMAVHLHYTRAWSTLPTVLSLKNSKVAFGAIGVFAAVPIERRVKFGPFIGRSISAKDSSQRTDQQHMWDIFHNWKPDHILDATDEEESNWMRFVKFASKKEYQNLVAFQYCGELFFRTCREIKAGEELLVWYEDEYCCELDELHDHMMTLEGARFSCSKCNVAFLGSTFLFKHKKYRCEKEKYDCWICQEEFPSEDRMVEHIHDHTRVPPQTEEGANRKLPHIVQQREVFYECKECSQSFRTKRGLCNHKRCHTWKAELHDDKICTRVTQTKEECAERKPSHIVQQHKLCYECKECSQSFRTKRGLCNHKRCHTRKAELHDDKICTRVTQTKEECAERKPSHIVQQHKLCYECKECSQSFRTKQGLCNHKRCHTQKVDRPRHGKLYTQGRLRKLHSFKTHYKVHKKRTFSCKSCGRWCGSKLALVKHTGACHWSKRNSHHVRDAHSE